MQARVIAGASGELLEGVMKIITSVLAVAVLTASTAGAQSLRDDEYRCRASIAGDQLLTVYESSTGYMVEGPWRIVRAHPTSFRANAITITAVIDRIVEYDPQTRERQTIPFPDAVEVVFEGQDENDLILNAARVWCATVTKAQTSLDAKKPVLKPAHKVSALAIGARGVAR